MFPETEVIRVGRMGTMGARKVARTLKMGRKSAAKITVVGAAVATAATVVVGAAPPASALDVNQQVYTAGPLLNLLPALGIDSLPIALGVLPVVGDTTLILNFVPIAYDAQNIYNTINALPFAKRGTFSSIYDRVIGAPADPPTQFPGVLGSGIGTRNLVESYRAQISSVNGTTPPGYTPFQPVPGANPTQTNQVLLYLRNPLRPNGGIDARFAPLLNLFGVDTTLPAAGVNTGTGLKLNTATVDVTWAYDLFSDFPVTLNPFSLVNSLLTFLPVNLVGGVALKALDTTAAGLNVASVLGILNRLSGGIAGVDDGQAWYGTLLPNDLPILEPLRLPSRLINAVFGTDLGTPIADALQPAFTILVNTGYSDVVTPADIAADPTLANTYSPYDRTFLTSATPEPFLSVNPLTPAEWLQVPGDVVRALFTGFSDVFFPSAPSAPPASVLPSLAPPAPASIDAASAAPVSVDPVSVAPQTAGVSADSVREARSSVRDATTTATAGAPRNRGAAVRRAAIEADQAATVADQAGTDDAASVDSTASAPSAASAGAAGPDRDAASPKRATRSAARVSN
jgi:hypothetical protein